MDPAIFYFDAGLASTGWISREWEVIQMDDGYVIIGWQFEFRWEG